MEEQSENTCDLCKISYASESELKDHVWSLMHHIKIEQRKKGCEHTCSLCLASCENIIEYGKHLNEDKHKHALSRRNKDPNSTDILDSFGDGETFGRDIIDSNSRQYERDAEFREPDPVPGKKSWTRSARNSDRNRRGGHSRSYSEPDIDLAYQDYGGPGNRYFGGMSKNKKNKQKNKKYGPQGYWEGPAYEDEGEYGGHWEGDNQGYWNGCERDAYWNWGGPAGYGQFASQGLYTPFDDGSRYYNGPRNKADWRYGNASSFKDLSGNFNNGNSNRRGSFDSSFDKHSRSFSDQERRGRGLTRGPGRGRYQNRPESLDKSSPDSNSSNDSAGLKRRRDDDHESANGKLRKGNSNKRILEVSRPLAPGDDYIPDPVDSLMKDKLNQRQSTLRDKSSSHERMSESLPVRMETSPSRQPLLQTPARSHLLVTPVRSTERPKQVTWASDMVSSTTDIDADQDTAKHRRPSPVATRRSSSLDSALKRNKLPDSTSDKKAGKKLVSGKDGGKAKMKAKPRQTGSSPVGQKRSPRRAKDEGESVLEKAEKLCKKLREEREKGKKEKQMKEKQKKLDKHKDLNFQIKELNEKNKANIKGHLEAAESMIDKHERGTVREQSSRGLLNNSPKTGVLEKAAASLGITVQNNESIKGSTLSSNNSKPITKGVKPDIQRIRETIENSVRTEVGEGAGYSVLTASKSNSQSSPKVDSGSPAFPSPLAKHMLSKQKSDSGSNYETDHLLKMVNSPRSTKERLQIAQMLRTHAKSQTKLSLPRFNLKMSDICSGSGDRQDEIADLNLEAMSPDMQLEIANLIEADVKPDIAELEKLLDFQSAANEMLDSNVLTDLGILTPVKDGASGEARAPIVLPSSLHKQFSSSESAVSRLKGASVPIKQDIETVDLEHNSRKEYYSGQIMNTISSPRMARSSSPARREVPTLTREIDSRPRLSIEDLTVEASDTRDTHLNSPLPKSSVSKIDSYKSVVQSLNKETHIETKSDKTSGLVSLSAQPAVINIKEEMEMPGYEKAEGISKGQSDTFRIGHASLRQNNENRFSNKMEVSSELPNMPDRTASPVRQNLFLSTNLGRDMDEEMPVKDTVTALPVSGSDNRTALEKVKSILDEAPNMEKVLGYRQGGAMDTSSAPPTSIQSAALGQKDASLDVSHGSQTSSVLDQVYTISLQEETVRQELTTVNQKISQLQRLIDEAMQQMNKFTERKDTLLKEEDQMRSTRMKLLQDSRSQSSVGSQHEAPYQSALSHLTDAQLNNLNNPVFIKFLMSQRNQSDLSSVGGFSNVETGSQMEGGPGASRSGSRRGSFTSNITEPVSITADRTLTPRGESSIRDENSLAEGDDGKFLTQSVDLLSGSAPSVRSSNIHMNRHFVEPVQDKNFNSSMTGEKNDGDRTQTESQNSFSFLNTPLDKGGFVTLDQLMNQTSDIGKLLQRSLERADNTIAPISGKENLNADQGSKETSQSKPVAERERRDSVMSADSDDIVVSGSDIEKYTSGGKVSMKYMGTIPDNVHYTDFMKQIASDSKGKSVLYTVVTSPDAVSHLKKLSDSGMGTGSLSSQGLPKPNIDETGLPSEVKDPGYKSDGSVRSTTTGTLTVNDLDFESQSVKSTYSLGERIKRMCEGQNLDSPQTPRSVSEGDKTITVDSEKFMSKIDSGIAPPQSPSRKMLQSEINRQEDYKSSKMQTSGIPHDSSHNESSPTRKKLKTKKERDRNSRRKQKEEFILESSSDTNSVEEESLTSLKSKLILRQPSLPEEDFLVTGSEDQKKSETGDLSEKAVKKSLLDEVQLETETPSDSCDDRNKGQATQDEGQSLKMRPEVLESFRSAVKTKLQVGKSANQSTPVIQYKGPKLSVAAIQVFKGDVYVCYGGSELRRFNFKTGEILKELDCSPYLVHCLLVSSVDEREDILYTGGVCKKLMLFKPQKFNLIETYDYDERITCLHENWGRLFVGLSDGVVSVRSMKTDKELNLFQTTNRSVQSLSSTSAGMTKMLCCGCADKLIYVLDAISGLLLTMLQGHTLPPLCIEIFDDLVVSGAADKSVLVHNVRSGCLEATIKDHKAMVSQVTSDKDYIYTACYDKFIRCYSKQDFKLQRVFYGSGKGMLTSIIYHDDKLLTGNKEGLVESFPVSLSSSWSCQCDGCKIEFVLREHLLHHVLTDHLLPNSRMLQCPWSGCSSWLSTIDGTQKAEEHIVSEHIK